jgi:hypothetical protein
MAFATGEVVPTPGNEHPFKVVFTVGGSVFAEWPVNSVSEGEDQIVMVLKGLHAEAKKDGFLR